MRRRRLTFPPPRPRPLSRQSCSLWKQRTEANQAVETAIVEAYKCDAPPPSPVSRQRTESTSFLTLHSSTLHPPPSRAHTHRTLALAKHPDKVARLAKAKAIEEGRDPVAAVESANAQFQRIRVAYDVLGDAELRRDYVDMLDHDKFEEQRSRRTREKAKTSQSEQLRLQAGLPNRCTCPFVDDVSPIPEKGQPAPEHAAALLEWRCRDAEFRNVVGYEIQGMRSGGAGNWEALESGVPWDRPCVILAVRNPGGRKRNTAAPPTLRVLPLCFSRPVGG